MIKKNKGFTRVYKAAYHSYRGLLQAVCHEAAFQQEVILAVILIPATFFLDVTNVERILLVSAIVFVMVVELLNTAVEAVVDRVGYEHHVLAGQAKDLGSAAVFVSIFLAIFIWVSILFFG